MAYIIKITIAVIIIIAATELSKKSTSLAAILLGLPIVLFTSFTFIWEESKDINKISLLTQETVVILLAGIPFLFLLTWLLKNGFNYYLALGASCTGIILVTLIIQKYFLH
ncbi:hypothetical protein PQZ09_01955 [Methylophilaceae bacterium]|jgi:hypothetical protein|nr:hypothetical protein [Methylophilaceae bacterium]|tara:strand:+ start:1629 stop:1961 length:333 start_codon:yes stop_codon:yes gene_type:complete